jgi:ATP-binding cassette subfamily B protein
MTARPRQWPAVQLPVSHTERFTGVALHMPGTQTMTRSLRALTAQVRPLLGGQRAPVAGLVLASVLAAFCESGILATVAQAAAALVDGAQRVHASIGPIHIAATIGVLLGAGLVLAVARLALQAPLSIVPSRIAADAQARLQRELFEAYTLASWSEQSRDREGHLQELVTNQVLQASSGALAATGLVTSVLTLVILVFSALLLNVVAALAVSLAAVIMFGLVRPLNNLAARRSRALSQSQMNLASGIGQATRLAEETHVFGVGTAQRDTADALVQAERHLFYRTQMLGRLTPGVYQGFVYLLIVGGIAVIAAVHSGHVASLGAVVLLLVRAGGYGQQVAGGYQILRQALPFIERVQGAERRYRASTPVTGDQRLQTVQSLAFEHVTFAYAEGRPVLSDVSFDVRGGETIGVVGPSGAGKSTLVQILLQLRVPESGVYLVNGVPAAQFDRRDWHAKVAYVPQEPKLLHASVADNIRYFRPLSADAVERAARLARIHDDIVGWEDGYDTVIGPRADAVSGGQQQRICIARALVAQPEVLVLDEPTSALDPRSESLLQESLTAVKQGLTLFIIAHRMSTLEICGRVMVLADGQLDAFDTATRLREGNAYYRQAAELAGGPSERTSA